MHGPQGHYTKRSKSDRERQIPYNLIYMCNLKNKKASKQTTKLIDKENR